MATKLLLADDSPTIAKILQMSLQSEPYEIRAVLTAEEALKELRANPPYFFLVDLTLPGKNGYEFARFIKQDSKLATVRVVLLASAFEPVDEAEYQACGADAVVKKPFDPSELRAKLRSIVDAPPKFPKGSKVSGSLSGFEVIREKTKDVPLPPATEELLLPTFSAPPASVEDLALPSSNPNDELANLLQGNVDFGSGDADADAILANLLGAGADALPMPEADSSPAELESVFHAPAADTPAEPMMDLMLTREEPAAAAHVPQPIDLIPTREETPSATAAPSKKPERVPVEKPEHGGATVALDLSGEMESATMGENVLDLSASFNTPPGGTAMIDMGQFREEAAPAPAVPATPTQTKPMPAAPAEKAPANAMDELSANAQALAAFFSAEIQQKTPPAPTPTPAREPTKSSAKVMAPPPPESDSFDASLDSIEWDQGPAEASLSGWSSSPPKPRGGAESTSTKAPAAASSATKAVTQATVKSSTTASRRVSAAASGSPSLMFDTAGSTFRFAEDYVTRITKSFTGHIDETVPEKAHTPPTALFGNQSDDRPPSPPAQARPGFAGGGAWSEQDVQRIEQIVREEVQMVVREVAEKIAWEVIPELAENLIRKELEKVLKEMEP